MNPRVLIVDDEENIRQMIRLTLETAGYEVGEAQDGNETFAILGGDASWDVVLLDQRLPGMEGTDVLRRIRVLAPSARVVMMTAFASVELAVQAMKLGAGDFLRKPMTPEIVRNAVTAAVNSKPHEETAAPMKVVTLNGFTISRAPGISSGSPGLDREQRFLVRTPEGRERQVVVEISAAAIEAARRVTPSSSSDEAFWAEQAEQFLNDFIWTDGNVPATGRLVLKAVDPDLGATLSSKQ